MLSQASNWEILDRIFKDPDVKWGLKVFDGEEVKSLDLWEEEGP